MPVAGVFAEADVGNDQEFRQGFLDGSGRLLHDSLCIVSAGPHFIFLLRNAEHDHRRDIQPRSLTALLDQEVHRPAVVAGHGADLLLHLRARTGKKRVDELARVETGLADEAAKFLVPSQSAGTFDGKRHGKIP